MSLSTSPSGADPLRVVILGAGRRGQAHARAAIACGVTVAGVFDPDEHRARALAAEMGGVVYPSVARALQDEPDAVAVTSPPPIHTEQALAVLASGGHIFLEKPIALTLDEACAIGKAAERAGRLVHVCQQHRYSRGAELARSALAGKRVALVHERLYRPAPDVRANWNRAWGGGHIVKWAIHPLDLCRYLIGEVESAYAVYANQVLAGTEGWDNWDAYSCSLRFRNGAVGSVATTYAAWPGASDGPQLEIVAEELIVRWWGRSFELSRPDGSERIEVPTEPTVDLHAAFWNAIRTGDHRALRQTYEDAVRTLALVLACNESNACGRPVALAG